MSLKASLLWCKKRDSAVFLEAKQLNANDLHMSRGLKNVLSGKDTGW